jgi:hypothetical protein
MIADCIVVGLDDSAAARAAHRWAAAYANATGKDLRAVHVLEWPIGLTSSAVKSGTRLHVPRQEVAEAYWRGMHRVFDDITSPRGSALQFAQVVVLNVRVSACRRPRAPGVRRHTVNVALPTSRPATRSNMTSMTSPFLRKATIA